MRKPNLDVVSVRKALVLLVVPALLMTACAAAGEGNTEDILRLTFDGESCTYDGPTDLKPGLVTLIFLNESDDWAATNMIRLLGDKTLEDLISYNGEEPSQHHAPSWSVDIPGVWREIRSGESHTWEGVLEPGIHALVCARTLPWPEPLGVWLGTGLTVDN